MSNEKLTHICATAVSWLNNSDRYRELRFRNAACIFDLTREQQAGNSPQQPSAEHLSLSLGSTRALSMGTARSRAPHTRSFRHALHIGCTH